MHPITPEQRRLDAPSLACRHEVQFYSDDRFLIGSLAAFLGTSLEAGNSAIVVATEKHCELLAQELQHSGVGLDAAVEQGRYLSLDAAEVLSTFRVNGTLDSKLFRESIGGLIARANAAARNRQNGKSNKTAIFGEMVALLWSEGNFEAAIELEKFWSDLGGTYSFYLRCGYPLAGFDRDEHRELFSQICGYHHVVIPAESYTALVDENDQMLAIARLQQTEQALKTESTERRLAQARSQEVQNLNRQLLEEVQKRESEEDELRRFTRRLLMVRDEEQRRIAAELHENTAQLLAALSLYFSILHEEKDSLTPRLSRVVDSSQSVAESLLKEIRKLSHLLHPPTLDDIGLAAALKEYTEQFTGWSGISVDLEVSPNLGRLGRHVEIAIFRIVEEALANVRQHSHSASATVSLSRSSDTVLVEIQDRGSGIVRRHKGTTAGVGITGMRERARELGGSVRIQSNASGTLVSVNLPLQQSH